MPHKFPKRSFHTAQLLVRPDRGKQVRLHPDERQAMQLYHELRAKRDRLATKANSSTLTAPAALRVTSGG